MVVTQTADRKNNLYSVTLQTEFDSHELTFMSAYGEPSVQIGGTIPYGGSEATFEKNPSLVLIRSQFPVMFGINAAQDADAVLKVDAWATMVLANLQAALNTLLGNPTPAFPDVTVFPIHYVAP